ncbi:MAG: hypothetical protein IT357_06455 [Gemmatimonadaceae bacterium]|nr:hypothetical protein [Gemmatimonadaceae bacterium]
MPQILPASLLRRVVMSAVLLAPLAAACVDEPFARVNPNDEDLQFTMRIVASRDTISPANPVTVLRVVTEPEFLGYEPNWFLAVGAGVVHRGNGVWEMTTPPTVPGTLRIRAFFEHQEAEIAIVRMPAP